MTVVEAAYGPDDPDRAALEEIERDTATVLQRLRATTPLVQRIRGLYRRD
jgi:hypothetical protein